MGNLKNRNSATSKHVLVSILLGIFLILLVQSLAPTWQTDSNYTITEDSVYVHNLRANITGYNNDIIFAINPTGQEIYWTNQLGRNSVEQSVISPWINITDSNGDLTINATKNNQTGFFEIPIKATNISDTQTSPTTYLYFIVNAINDNPAFIELNSTYIISEPVNQLIFVNASDEENQYPLNFSIVFTSCEHANWSNRTDCNLFNITSVSDVSALLNFTPSRNDVGEYNVTFSVRDNGEDYSCPHDYCDSELYEKNKTISQNVTFKVLSSFDINASECQNIGIINEGSVLSCNINITTSLFSEDLTVWTNASLPNYPQGLIYNKSWFYPLKTLTSSQSIIQIPISVTPRRNEVGNWLINFSARDSLGNIKNETILIEVNRTVSSLPILQTISNLSASINLLNSTQVIVFDNDLLIPDKIEGYNETLTFSLEFLNQSTLEEINILSSQANISVIDYNIQEGGILTNKSSANLSFFFNSDESGLYTVRVNVSDLENNKDSTLFNLTVIENTAPEWNASRDYTFNFTVNSTRAGNALQSPIYVNLTNITEMWIADSQGNEITFSNVSTGMTYFNLTSDGIINFIPYKEDVGVHNVVIYATDSLGLTSTQTFIFNISNTNTEPFISQQSNVIVNETDPVSGVMALKIYDDDLLINDETFRDSLNISWIVLNGTTEVDLFTFTLFDSEANNSTYYATDFTPSREDIGNYTILVNATDESNITDEMTFNLEIRQKYYSPVINFPVEGYVFNLTENTLSSLMFNVTHSAGDNLTYTLYLNGTLRTNFSSYGNGQTNATWSFTPNFTDETHENLSVLQLIVLNPYENTSRNFSVNITHTNSPLNFTTNISDMEIQGYTKNMDLSDYFEDLDAFDIYHNQTVNFTIRSNESSSALTWNFTGWNATISSGSSVVAEILNITAEDINITDSSVLTTAESNNFEISFVTPTPIVITTPTSGGGGGGTRPETCVPDWNAEFSMCIDGQRTINYWDENGCSEDFVQTAPCDDPGTVLQKLVFTEELITIEHPECIEALEAVKEAETLINNGDLKQASDKLDSVINWCREAITQSSDALFTKPQDEPQRGIIWWVAVIFSVSLFLEVIYYFIYREVRLRRIANTKI